MSGVDPEVHSVTWNGASSIDVSPYANVHLDLTGRGTAWHPTLSMRPNFVEVKTADTIGRLTLTLGAGHQIGVRVKGSGPHLLIVARGAGRDQTRFEVESDQADRVEVHDSTLKLTVQDPTPRRNSIEDILVSDGAIELDGCDVVRVRMQGMSAASVTNLNLGELAIRNGSSAQIPKSNATIERLVSYGKATSEQPGFLLSRGTDLSVRHADGMFIAIAESARFEVTATCSLLGLRGHGMVKLSGLAQDVDFGNELVLSMGEHSSLIGARGQVVLGDVKQSTIAGRRLDGNESSALHVLRVSTPDDLERVTLSNVTIPISSEGLLTISALSLHALQVTPSLSRHLPGRRTEDRRPFARRLHRSNDLEIAAVYAQELSNLASARSPSGATRSQLKWCAYRMRNLTAGAGERALLSVYRLIGYGERFGPPFLAFLIASLTATWLGQAPGNAQYKIDGLEDLLRAWASWLAVPMHIIDSAADDPYRGHLWRPFETTLRLLVAIPFVTAVLAVRKFVKEPRSST